MVTFIITTTTRDKTRIVARKIRDIFASIRRAQTNAPATTNGERSRSLSAMLSPLCI